MTTNVNSSYGTEIVANYHLTGGTRSFAHATGTGTISFYWISGATQSEMTITPAGS